MSHTRKREISNVWKYFTKASDAATSAVCKSCDAKISRGGKNASVKGFSTSNLWNHLKRWHSEEIETETDNSQYRCESVPPPKKQATIIQILENSKKYAVDDNRAKEITRLIAEEICVDMEPLNHVNKIGFQRLMTKLCPRYEMVSRTHLTQTILPDMCDRVQSKIKLELNSITHLCITSDMWTSDSSSNINDFISITAHGLNSSFELKNFYLEVMPFEGESHSGELISQNLCQAFNKWEIVEKVRLAVTDNARNVVNAINNIPNVEHFSCMAHSLQLVLQDALFKQNEVKDMVSIARKIVGHFSHSTKAIKKLRAVQEEYNVPTHVLIQDVPTRWDSTYLMLDRLNEQRIAIQAVLPQLNVPVSSASELNTQQWILIEQVVKILKYFNDVTKALSENDVTLADAIPLANSLFKALEGVQSENPTVHILTENLKLHLNDRLGNLEEIEKCILATALDPRYKLRTFRIQNTITKTKALLYSGAEAIPEPKVYESEAFSSDVQPSTSSGIWSICQQIIENVEGDEPLAIFASKC